MNNLDQKKILEISKYNKYIQKRLNININNYNAYSEKYSSIEIELELRPNCGKYMRFININLNEFYQVYFDNNREIEIRKPYFDNKDKVSKINIIIDYQVDTFFELFKYCHSIYSINFKKFARNNITNMGHMFYGCTSLEKINLSNFNTSNVTDMSYMFHECQK